MSRTLRTFVGLRVGGAVAEALHHVAAALGRKDPALRVVALQDLHLTLKFLGATSPDAVEAVTDALRAPAAVCPALPLRIVGLTAFPHSRRPRVLVARVHDESDGALAALAHAVEVAVTPLGFAPERRPFRPHVTLARVGGRPAPATLRALEADEPGVHGRQTLSEVALIVSRPGKGSYHYSDLTTLELGAGGSAPPGA